VSAELTAARGAAGHLVAWATSNRALPTDKAQTDVRDIEAALALLDERDAAIRHAEELEAALRRLASWDEMAGNGDPAEFPTFYRQEIAARINTARAALRSQESQKPPEPVTEYGFCGSLDWTVKQWGRVTHKHSCPNRTDPFCQTHPDGCPSEPPETENPSAT